LTTRSGLKDNRPMKISSQEEYGLRCLLQVARDPSTTPVPISEIASREGLSVEYVGKLLMKLRKGGLVSSVRGKAGGYQLVRDTSRISLHQIIEALEGVDDFERCILGLPECSDTDPCVMHERWGKERERIKKMFANVSLKDLAAKKDLRS